MTRARQIVLAGFLVVAAFVLGAVIVQAVRQHNFGPIWTVGWLPAVMVGAWFRPGAGGRCRTRRTQP